MKKLKNYINGNCIESKCKDYLDVEDPGNGEIISQVPLGCKEDIDLAAEKAADAYVAWRNVPAVKRIVFW